MLTALNDIILKIADPLLGWLLWLPTDVVLILVSVATGALLTFARPWTTNQDLLRRCHQDKRRLKQLIREAKRNQDKEAVRRYKASVATIMMKTVESEGMPLLPAIVPVAILATWCFFRLEFHPPRAGEPIPLYVYFPVSADGNLVHVVPQDGVAAEDGWIKQIQAVTDPAEGPPHAVAQWNLRAEPKAEPYTLDVRYQTDTFSKRLLVGQRTYLPPVEFFPADSPVTCTELKLPQVKLFGVLPGVPWLAIAPWLFAYLLLAVPSVFLVKRITGIY